MSRPSLKTIDQLQRIPPPPHRHACPSAPWPWVDLDADVDNPESPEGPSECIHMSAECGGKACWAKYPQSLFPNWSPKQVKRSRMKEICAVSNISVIHGVDVGNDGQFSKIKKQTILDKEADESWKSMQNKRPSSIRVRALFVENLSVPALKMLGTKYNIEPFFFTSSTNWIPSRYEEDVRPAQGDHITITLPFIRAMRVPTCFPPSLASFSTTSTARPRNAAVDQVIDTQLPLSLRADGRTDDHMLLLDLLAVHMVRKPESSTIISYHPNSDRQSTSAKRLHSRVCLAGESVYWQHIFQQSDDPTFLLLTILWYAVYSWDEALEILWEHICQLELTVMNTNDMLFTQEGHKIRAHLLHYASLLDDFRKSVEFVLNTPNPAMDSLSHDDLERQTSSELLKRECNNLLMEIERLTRSRGMQDKRLKNVMNLAFSSVNIEDSKRMQRLTEAAVRDSAAMKQIAYLSMVFLPGSFAAGVFGMNIREINPDALGSLVHYVETAIPLTIVTVWVVVAFQGHFPDDQEVTMWTRLWWPLASARRLIERRYNANRRNGIGVQV